MNKNLSLCTCVCYVFLFCCQHTKDIKNIIINKNTKSFSSFPKEERLMFKKLFEFKEALPAILQVIDSTVVMFNVNPSVGFTLFNYSLNDKRISKRYLSRGRGPGEVIGVRNFGINKDYLWVYDVTLKKMLVADKYEILDEDSNVILKDYPIKHGFYTACLGNNLSYYGVGNESKFNKIEEINLSSDKFIREFGKFESVPSNASVNSVKQVYQSFIYIKPKNDKAVLSYRFTDLIEIYDINTKTSKAIHGPNKPDVNYNLVNGNMHRTDETTHAFIGGATTDEYIYLLYSGKTNNLRNPFYGKSIYVYDWDGNPIKKLSLDREVLCFTVLDDNKTIYAYDPENELIIEAEAGIE